MSEEPVTFLLHHLVSELDAFADAHLRVHYGLTFSQFHFLAIVGTLGSADVTSVAAAMSVSKAAVSKRLRGFVDEGLIELGNDPKNARRVLISLTRRGGARVQRAGAALDDAFTALFAGRPELDLTALRGAVSTLLALVAARNTSQKEI